MTADLLVIGAGTAGLRTAVTAAANGAKVVLVGEKPIAGTCLNNGCIPTKAMLHAADVYRTCKNAKEVGISTKQKVNFKKLMDRVRRIVHSGRSHVEKAVKKNKNIEYIPGRAKFIAKNTIEVNHKRITAKKIIIATGTKPMCPPIQGLKQVSYCTNVEAVELTKQPKNLIIIGGGYIACEYATFFSTIGTNVTIVERAPDILMALDPDIKEYIRSSLEANGVKILTGVATTNISCKRGKYTCSISGSKIKKVIGDHLIVACGREPNTDLDLQNTGVKTNEHGFIVVDKFLRTSNKDIYAIGDVNGKALFAHAAKREGWLTLEHALLDSKKSIDHSEVPWAIFTHPVAAGIGKSESQLKKENLHFEVLEVEFDSCGKAKIIRESEGKVKILHNQGKILGAFIVGPEADNLIHEFVALRKLGSKAISALEEIIHIHPTLAEVNENLAPR